MDRSPEHRPQAGHPIQTTGRSPEHRPWAG